jgi:hypothetical protein
VTRRTRRTCRFLSVLAAVRIRTYCGNCSAFCWWTFCWCSGAQHSAHMTSCRLRTCRRCISHTSGGTTWVISIVGRFNWTGGLTLDHLYFCVTRFVGFERALKRVAQRACAARKRAAARRARLRYCSVLERSRCGGPRQAARRLPAVLCSGSCRLAG